MAGALAVSPLAHADDHGDDRASATPVELPSEVSGEIDPPGDEDWFRFEAPRAGTLTIRGRATSGDLTLELAIGSLRAWTDGEALNWELSLDVGTHYLVVQNNDRVSDGGTGDYTLELLFEEVADDHGDDRASATHVELPSETAGEIGTHDDADWFRFEVAASGWVTIRSVYRGGNTAIIGTLYDAERNALAQEQGAFDSWNFSSNQIWRRLDAGTYFVRVAPTYYVDGSSYVLQLDTLPTGTAPTVSDVRMVGVPSDGATYEVGEAISVVVTFDNAVEVSGRPGLALTIGSRTQQANYDPVESWAGRLNSIMFSYVVQPSDRDFDGLSIGANALKLNGGTIRDLGGTTNASLALGSHKISNAAGRAVDGRRESVPTVSRVSWGRSPQGDTYEVGQAIVASVFFDRSVVVTGQPSLALTIGETVRQAGMPSQSRHSSVLTFRYVVQPSDRDEDGIGIGAGALTLNGGTIRRSGSNVSASLSLGDHAVANMADHKVDGSRETAPALSRTVWMPFPPWGDTFEVGEVIMANVAYDREVEVTGEPQLELQIGSATRQARFFRQAGSSQVLFQYVVQPSDADVDGISIDATALKLNGGTIRTRGGTANAALDFGSDALQTSFYLRNNSYFLPDIEGVFHRVDGGRGRPAKATYMRIVSIPAGGSYSAGDEITALVSFDKAVEVGGVPQLALTIGPATRQASYVEYLEAEHVVRYARWLYFRYVVQPSDRDDDGIGIGAGALSLNGGTITTQGSGTNAELEIGAAAAIDNDWLHKVNAGGTSSDDHGDDLSSATRVALPSETAGEAGGASDADWFRFEVSASGEVTAETTGRLDAVGTLYDVGGNVLGEDDDSGAGLNFRIRRALDAGTYFVRVVPFGSATGSYALRLSAEAGSSTAATFRDCAECPLMVRIPAGTFTMGAPESETGSLDHERPQRIVSIPDFAAGAHEVTFAQWDACVADGGCGGHSPDDEGWGRDNRPVFGVSWDDAQLYVDWLSRSTGQRYRLLTESEWEYAARAGATTPFHTGSTITPQQANFDGRYDYPAQEYDESGLFRGQTLPVGSFAPNGFGLYDMHGNMWEWVQDCYGGYAAAASDGSAVGGDCIDRVLRGGSWLDEPPYIRAANRNGQASRAGGADDPDFYGFRVARTL